ncbi:MAG: hypothetical protein IKH41_00515 [Clostridia bacterium]|nr:hypothetical protein [Clostridia bacterium]
MKRFLKKTVPLTLLLIAGAAMILTGCTAKPEIVDGTETLKPTGDPGGSGGEELIDRGGNAAEWEARTMEELLVTGAVTQLTADAKVYNAIDLGVPADGRTDASEAILNAAAAVISKGGGILYFPTGRYKVNSALKIDGNDGAWLCFAGDPAGSSVIFVSNSADSENAALITVARDNTHFSFLTFTENARNSATFSLEASGCSLYGCRFTKNSTRCAKPCLEISGSYNTVRQCGFEHVNTAVYQVEFTKYPGRDARGNVLCDTHFGGSYTKCTLISSHDPDGAPEAISIVRNLYLIPSEPMIEVRSVNGLLIANNMLDAASTAVGIAPEGSGVYNVEIRDNYMGGSKGGVRMTESDAAGAGISVHDNYIWAPDSVTVYGQNYSALTIRRNYCVLTGGNALFMRLCVASDIGENLVANISGASPELDIMSIDAASHVDTKGYGSVNMPGEGEKAEITPKDRPDVPEAKTPDFAKMPQITGDVSLLNAPNKYFNVKDYGALGDGTTDDTEAVTKCVKAAKAASGTAYFPAGTYVITKTIKVSKDDSKILTFKGDGAGKSRIVGAESLDGHIFDIAMKYNFNMKDLGMEHKGQGSCIDALYVKAFDCTFTSGETNTAPLMHFHGSNCWAVRCRFDTANQESYGLCYTRLPNEISINDFVIDNVFSGPGKGVLVGNGTTVGDGRCEGLKVMGNTFGNTGKTQVEVYEILHVNIAYNKFDGAENAIFLSNLGYGPDGIYIDHNVIGTRGDGITSGKVEGGGDYISMVVIHDNDITAGSGVKVSEPVPFNKKMVE